MITAEELENDFMIMVITGAAAVPQKVLRTVY